MPSPRPVPAAITATLPLAMRVAFLQHRELVAVEHRDRVGQRLEIVEQPHAAEAAALHQRRGVERHGTLVSCATWSVTAPATPNDAASISPA